MPRFAAYYTQLQALPRHLRRLLQRRLKQSLAGVALLLALGQAPALAGTINVDGTTCTLIDAITAANNDAATGGCSAGSGADTIVLQPSSVHTLTAVNNTLPFGATGLPVISSEITIAGHNSTITRDSSAPNFRIFTMNRSGHLTLQETTVSGGVGVGSNGGGVLNFGTVTIKNSTVSGNSATDNGGGVYNLGTMTITNSTVSGNSAGNFGGGVYNGSGDGFSSTVTIANSTLSDDRTVDATDTLLHTFQTPALDPGREDRERFDIPLPASLNPRGKFLILVIDADNQVAENVETNNEVAFGL